MLDTGLQLTVLRYELKSLLGVDFMLNVLSKQITTKYKGHEETLGCDGCAYSLYMKVGMISSLCALVPIIKLYVSHLCRLLCTSWRFKAV